MGTFYRTAPGTACSTLPYTLRSAKTAGIRVLPRLTPRFTQGRALRSFPRRPAFPTSRHHALGFRVLAYSESTTPSTVLRFRTRRKLGPLDYFKITGSVESLGNWERSKAPRMVPYGEDVWELDVLVDPGTTVNFTCIVHSEGYEDGEQITHSVVVDDWDRVEIDFQFGQEGLTQVTPFGARASTGSGSGSRSRSALDHKENGGAAGWMGKQIQFMESNDHPHDRRGVWNVDQVSGLAKEIVAGDQDAGNWLKKLQLAKRFLVDESVDKRPDLDAVGFCHVYMSWINQGLVPCVEAGGHRRPNNHAEVSKMLFRSLEWVIEPGKRSKELIWTARQLQTKIPSFSAEYTRSEPLTRIRDIAHRNDIPKQMKSEIKHTIQNKLHRNAGPEDLVAAELMYERILSDKDNLSGDFVREFGLFMNELRDFFNAGSLVQLLEKIGPTLVSNDNGTDHVVNHFVSLSKELDGSSTDSSAGVEANRIMETLHALTTVRAVMVNRLNSGLRNDAPDAALSMRQYYRLAEIRCEEYAFVLLSRFVNLLEKIGGEETLVGGGSDQNWALPLGALILGIRHVGMAGWDSRECFALENELTAWHKEGKLMDPVNALRLKATLERLQRLCEGFCDSVLDILTPRVDALSTGLGVGGHQVQVYAESEIRASVVFQVSKLNTMLLKACRKISGQSSWDVLVPGVATGKLVSVDRLDCEGLRESGDLVLVVKRAEGDEDIAHLVAGAGRGGAFRVTGVILCQELPHLSHLGVRARQENLVFAACWDSDILQGDVLSLTGKTVRLSTGSTGVELVECSGDVVQIDNGKSSGALQGTSVFVESEKVSNSQAQLSDLKVVEQVDAHVLTCGPKSANCGELARISEQSGTFKVPTGVSLSFTAMEESLSGSVVQKLCALFDEIDRALGSGGVIDETVVAVRDLIMSQSPSGDLLNEIAAAFEPGSRVIVRSSSNMEDMAGMSGAGLHDSIPNVDVSNPDELGEAIAGVWASLHTKRALQSRHATGVPHTQAKMGVLIQEQLSPAVSFVLHTTDPVVKDAAFLSAEIAPGIGETLASGARGTPWRFTVNKQTAEVVTNAFANFSIILMPKGGPKGRYWKEVQGSTSLVSKVADYSAQPLSIEPAKRDLLGRKLVEIGTLLEREFGDVAQDVEGAVLGNDLYIVQSRPQPI